MRAGGGVLGGRKRAKRGWLLVGVFEGDGWLVGERWGAIWVEGDGDGGGKAGIFQSTQQRHGIQALRIRH